MRVDQSRNQDVVGEVYPFEVLERIRNLTGRKNLLDGTVAYGDGVVLEDCARRLDRNDPAGAEERSLGRYLGVPWTSTTTRRLGDRHSISPLRSFWSGQALTGSVLPKPRVSTLDASTPLETR